MQNASYQIDVINRYNELEQQLQCWSAAILSECSIVAWLADDVDEFSSEFMSSAQQTHARNKVVKIIQQLEYLNEQPPRSILLAPGIIGASEETIVLSEKLNDAKSQFKEAILTLKRHKLYNKANDMHHHIDKKLNARNMSTASSLAKSGLARLHLKQCYRSVPILYRLPKKISWTWANTKAITQITVEEAEQKLLKKVMNESIELQLRKLAQLPRKEKLAIVQELAPHMRANILFYNGDRVMIKGAAPIIFPADANTTLPEIVPPKPKDSVAKPRNKRADTRLEETAFLPSIRAYRYLRECVE